MRHIISILLQNEAGALSRVAALFSSRGYNIESLSVAPTEHSELSRLTLVTRGSDEVIVQITKQLSKLVGTREILLQSSVGIQTFCTTKKPMIKLLILFAQRFGKL